MICAEASVRPGLLALSPLPSMPGRPAYLPPVPQHGVPRLGQLLPADDPQHQLLLELPGQGVFRIGVEDAWGVGCKAGSPHQRGHAALSPPPLDVSPSPGGRGDPLQRGHWDPYAGHVCATV